MRVPATAVAVAASIGALSIIAAAQPADAAVFVARAPRVAVARAGVVTIGPACATRTMRVWVAGRFVYRSVRACP